MIIAAVLLGEGVKCAYLKSPKKFLAIKFLAIFCSWNGGLGGARFRRRRRRPSVSPKPERSESPKKAKSRKKNDVAGPRVHAS